MTRIIQAAVYQELLQTQSMTSDPIHWFDGMA